MVIAAEVAQQATQRVTQMLTYQGQRTGISSSSDKSSLEHDEQHNHHVELVPLSSNIQSMTCRRKVKWYSSIVLRSLGMAIREVEEEQIYLPSPEKCESRSSPVERNNN
jgi:hypothetical protein